MIRETAGKNILLLMAVAPWVLGGIDRLYIALHRSLAATSPCNDLQVIYPLRLLRTVLGVPDPKVVISYTGGHDPAGGGGHAGNTRPDTCHPTPVGAGELRWHDACSRLFPFTT